MKKCKYGLLGLLAPGAVMAQSSSTIDLSKATTAAGDISSALTSFYNTTIADLVVAVGGVALAVYLITVLFRWARRLGR